MTGYTYGYNINCLSNISSSKLLMKKQTNVYNIAEALPVLNNSEQLPKRRTKDSIWVQFHGMLKSNELHADNSIVM